MISLRWQHFVRLPSGSAQDFRMMLDARDPAAVAGALFSHWLEDGIDVRHQFLAMAEETMRPDENEFQTSSEVDEFCWSKDFWVKIPRC